jgi:hypothetical protein
MDPGGQGRLEDLFSYHSELSGYFPLPFTIKQLLDSDQFGNCRLYSVLKSIIIYAPSVLDALFSHNRYKYFLAKARSRAKLNGLCP